MKKLLLTAVFAICLSVSGFGVIHGPADPTTLHPVPNCNPDRFYVDDSTQKLWVSNEGSPCHWVLASSAGGSSSAGSATAGQSSDGSGGFVDNGCTVTAGVNTCAAYVTTGPGGGVGQYSNLAEGTAPTTDAAGNTFGGTGFNGEYADAAGHCRKLKQNGVAGGCIAAPAGTLVIASGKTATVNNTLTFTGTDSSSVAFSAGGTVSYTIASGTSALGTSAISSAACATVVTTTATGTATTDVIGWGFNGDPHAVTGYVPLTAGMLTIIAYPSANNVNFLVCNNTTSSITPGAVTLNWRVAR